MGQNMIFIGLGLFAGVFGGLLGIGGATVLIPALIYLFGFTQHQAQGTTLAIMVPPIGLLAAWRYYHAGDIKLGVVGFICIGFLFGGLIGAQAAQQIAEPVLRRIFGIFLLIVAVRMIFAK